MTGISELADEWDATGEWARRAAIVDAARSRDWIGARIARDWLMDELRCPDYTAEACLARVAVSAVPVRARKLKSDTWGFDGSDYDGTWADILIPSDELPLATRVASDLFSVMDSDRPTISFEKDWITGQFKLVDRTWGDSEARFIDIFGVRFERRALIDYFDLVPPNEMETVVPEAGQQEIADLSGSGGRPTGRHGDVIAAATLRLDRLPPLEFQRYTVQSLMAELKEDYVAIGAKPPSERSCETFAGGIIRVLRARGS